MKCQATELAILLPLVLMANDIVVRRQPIILCISHTSDHILGKLPNHIMTTGTQSLYQMP